MELLCARLGCGHQAAASIQFDADGSRVLIVDLADTTRGIPLCGHHTRTRTPPIGWTLVDERTGPVQPSLWNPAAPPPEQHGPSDRPAVRRPAEASFGWGEAAPDPEPLRAIDGGRDHDGDTLSGAEPASQRSDDLRHAGPSTPLLLRAFRNA